ncbi:MAG: alpha/beta hydrolase [Halocynthiibacter sp.]
MKSNKLRFLLVLALLVIGIVSLFDNAERALIYAFDDTHVTPQNAGAKGFKEETLTQEDETLLAWYHPPRSGKPTVLYFHGNAGNLATRTSRFNWLTYHGYGVLAPAYRGSSGSTGRPNEARLTKDAEMWLKHLLAKSPKSIVLYGESLGTGVAVKIAARQHPASRPIRAMILEAPYTSIPDILMHISDGFAPLARVLNEHWDSKSKIADVTVPLLILHGQKDKVIPIEHGRALFDAAMSKDKQFFDPRNGTHTNVLQSGGDQVLKRFLARF